MEQNLSHVEECKEPKWWTPTFRSIPIKQETFRSSEIALVIYTVSTSISSTFLSATGVAEFSTGLGGRKRGEE
jgi:hypothetical protein